VILSLQCVFERDRDCDVNAGELKEKGDTNTKRAHCAYYTQHENCRSV